MTVNRCRSETPSPYDSPALPLSLLDLEQHHALNINELLQPLTASLRPVHFFLLARYYT